MERIVELFFNGYISSYLHKYELYDLAQPQSLFLSACLFQRHHQITKDDAELAHFERLIQMANHSLLFQPHTRVVILECVSLLEHLLRVNAISSSSVPDLDLILKKLTATEDRDNIQSRSNLQGSLFYEATYYLSLIQRLHKDEHQSDLAKIRLLDLKESLFLQEEDESLQSLLLRFAIISKLMECKLVSFDQTVLLHVIVEKVEEKVFLDLHFNNVKKMAIARLLLITEYLKKEPGSKIDSQLFYQLYRIFDNTVGSFKNFRPTVEEVALHLVLTNLSTKSYVNTRRTLQWEKMCSELEQTEFDILSEKLGKRSLERMLYPLILDSKSTLHLNDLILICAED